MKEERIPCPINNGADMNSDAMLDNLFDDGEYLEKAFPGNGTTYMAVGFIANKPIECHYWLGKNNLAIKTTAHNSFLVLSGLADELRKRLTDEQVEPKFDLYSKNEGSCMFVSFFYKEEYAREFNS